jgi:uncharacterized membrane protein
VFLRCIFLVAHRKRASEVNKKMTTGIGDPDDIARGGCTCGQVRWNGVGRREAVPAYSDTP